MNEPGDKARAVKAFFEQTEVYLTYDYNLRIRLETIRTFLGDAHFSEVLDMPCGTGALSIPLLDRFDRLLMMDFSENMVATARENIPSGQLDKVELINTDFYAHDFAGRQFDLVIAVGILAHIEEPKRFLKRIAGLVKPGGKLIVQNTNAAAPFTYLIRAQQGLKRALGKANYKLNWLSEAQLLEALHEEGFRGQQSFRYHQSWLGLSHLFSNEAKYEKTVKAFGTAALPRNQSTGSDVMYLFQKAVR